MNIKYISECIERCLSGLNKSDWGNKSYHINELEKAITKQVSVEPEVIQMLTDLTYKEKQTTQGEWIVREMGNDCFIERPKQTGEAYGIEIMQDGDYDTKRADAEFIISAKRFVLNMSKHSA